MAKYSATNVNAGSLQNLTTTYKTLMALTAATATLRRAWVNDVTFGTAGTPADQAMQYDISEQTAAGTSTSLTPKPDDQADAAAGTVGSSNFSAEGTVTSSSSHMNIAANARATVRWVAAPGQELVIPATNLAGFAFRALSPGYTSTAVVTAKFWE